MVDYTYLSFRLLCRENGADMVFTEMIAPLGLTKANPKALQFLTMTVPEERPIGIQLLATTPLEIKNAIKFLAQNGMDENYDVLDLNFGCPSARMHRLNAGSLLLKRKNLDIFEEIVRVAVDYSPLPVSIKMRLGYDEITILATLKKIEELTSDLAWITVHLRLAEEKRSGEPRYEILPVICEETDFNIVANGNFWTIDKVRWAKEIGCIGVLIGRKARNDPDIFNRIKKTLTGRKSLAEYSRTFFYRRLLYYHFRYFGEGKYFLYVKRIATELLKGIPEGKQYRQKVQKSSSFKEITDIFNELDQKKENVMNE